MTILILTALLALWAVGALIAVSLCVMAARTERRPRLHLVGSRQLS
jgi:beta-lactamase regulating signal transducer with metallopeptidase domain